MPTDWQRRNRLLLPAGLDDWNRLREAKNLMQDGKSDQAWMVFSSLMQSPSLWTVTDTLDAVRAHSQRKRQWREAIVYAAVHRVACIELYRAMHADDVVDIGILEGETGDDRAVRSIAQILSSKRLALVVAEKWLSELCDPKDIQIIVESMLKTADTEINAKSVVAFILDAIDRQADWRKVLQDARIAFLT